jgi:hypothetical protein
MIAFWSYISSGRKLISAAERRESLSECKTCQGGDSSSQSCAEFHSAPLLRAQSSRILRFCKLWKKIFLFLLTKKKYIFQTSLRGIFSFAFGRARRRRGDLHFCCSDELECVCEACQSRIFSPKGSARFQSGDQISCTQKDGLRQMRDAHSSVNSLERNNNYLWALSEATTRSATAK